MQTIRASTQLNDNESRLLTDEQKAIIASAILSDPESGNFTISEMYLNDEGKLVVVYDDVAIP